MEERLYLCLEHGAAANPPHRRRRTAEREGSLPEPIAAAMAFLGRPTGADVVLDPTCGTGTLIAEAAALAPAARFVGIDADPAAAALARRNLAHLDGAVVLAGDGRRLDPGAGPVTLALANLPFGKQFGDSGENAALYCDILGRMASLAAPDWRGVFLTSDGEAFESAAAAAGMTVGERWPIRTRGEPATLYCLARAGGGREAVPGATDQAWDVDSATQE